MRIFLIIVISMILYSCQYGSEFKVVNHSDETIDSLKITNGFNEVKIRNLKPNETRSGIIDFKKNNPGQDGNFNITIYSSGKTLDQSFGYFTNGTPPESSVLIEIKNDTIKIN